MERKDLRWLWFAFVAGGLGLVGWWIAAGSDRWVTLDSFDWMDSGVAEIVGGTATMLAIAVAFVMACAMLIGARRRSIWPALPLTLAIIATLAIPLEVIADLVTHARPSMHATAWLAMSYVIDVMFVIGGAGVWWAARAQRLRAAEELAAVERELAQRQGDVVA